uniref:Uncharacterized protein n=1 Tax=Peronospora matthiolae TaxID=2874970 RepID=A0AAV1TUG1_9STRA
MMPPRFQVDWILQFPPRVIRRREVSPSSWMHHPTRQKRRALSQAHLDYDSRYLLQTQRMYLPHVVTNHVNFPQ